MRYINFLDHKVLKSAAATVLSITIAQQLELKYALTAGIIAIISIQGTRKEGFKVAFDRVIATIIGLLVSDILFYFMGYSYLVLGIFILIFMPICVRFNLIQGFLVNVVLATHLISEQSSSMSLLINEFALLLIGLGTALLFNLYMPDLNRELRKMSEDMGKTIQNILLDMSQSLKCNCVSVEEKKLFDQLKELGNRARLMAINEFNNSIISNNTMTIDYFNMRYVQYKILKRMRLSFSRLYQITEHALIISRLMESISYCTFEDDEVDQVLVDIRNCKEEFRNSELPKTREEFENRAVLYEFLNDLEEFATVVKEFLIKYPKKEKHSTT
ncbi:MAG: aromatic acid exporter family protein [Fusobacteriaceae bacterium]